jgi:hypothetical protein
LGRSLVADGGKPTAFAVIALYTMRMKTLA